jgi:hypothetical protein
MNECHPGEFPAELRACKFSLYLGWTWEHNRSWHRPSQCSSPKGGPLEKTARGVSGIAQTVLGAAPVGAGILLCECGTKTIRFSRPPRQPSLEPAPSRNPLQADSAAIRRITVCCCPAWEWPTAPLSSSIRKARSSTSKKAAVRLTRPVPRWHAAGSRISKHQGFDGPADPALWLQYSQARFMSCAWGPDAICSTSPSESVLTSPRRSAFRRTRAFLGK